jgi:hypothetical protein
METRDLTPGHIGRTIRVTGFGIDVTGTLRDLSVRTVSVATGSQRHPRVELTGVTLQVGPHHLDLTGHEHVTQPCDPPGALQLTGRDWLTADTADTVGPAGIEPTTPAV